MSNIKTKFTVSINFLKGEQNYEIWLLRIQSLLICKNLNKYILANFYNKFNEKTIKALFIIKLNLNNGPLL